MGHYQNISDIFLDVAELIRPPDSTKVTETAERYRVLHNPGSYIGPWKTDIVAYLREVQDTLASRDYKSCVYVKPAQSAGTESLLNWMLHTGLANPADMYIYQTAESVAREFMKDKVAKMIRHCPDYKAKLLPGKSGQTAYALRFKSGIRIVIGWPSINQLSGHSTALIAITDLDRMPDNIDGEGNLFDLGYKRTTSFGSFAMTYAESSPGKPVLEHNWRNLDPVNHPHLAPPCTGVLALYNASDRRRRYWSCLLCSAWFEPTFELLWSPEDETDLQARAEQAAMTCPGCGAMMGPEHKFELNANGVWLRERDVVALANGTRHITPQTIKERPQQWEIALHKPEPYGDRAGFWLKGPCAAFLSWKEMVLKDLRAWQTYETTGDYQPLKTTRNTDQCEPFDPPGKEGERTADELMGRAEDIGEVLTADDNSIKVVPPGVRFLYATVDVQKIRFVVQVHGICPGQDVVIVDRFDIWKSERKDSDGDPYPLAPATYGEDWKLLEKQVLDKTYPLGDGSHRAMAIRYVACDSGGAKSATGSKASTTEKAYKFFRYLKKKNKTTRFRLVKGGSIADAPRVEQRYPDSERKDRHAGARGDIPLLMLNANLLKDALDGLLDNTEPGTGMIHFPLWLAREFPAFFDELVAEARIPGKGWLPIRARNESWDLLVYCLALMAYHKIELIDWDKPPAWAEVWDKNSLVIGNKAETNTKAETLSDLGAALL